MNYEQLGVHSSSFIVYRSLIRDQLHCALRVASIAPSDPIRTALHHIDLADSARRTVSDGRASDGARYAVLLNADRDIVHDKGVAQWYKLNAPDIHAELQATSVNVARVCYRNGRRLGWLRLLVFGYPF